MKSSSVTKFSLTLMATVAVIGIATTASTKAQDGEVSPEVIAEVERLIMNMRQSRFDRHSCGSAPRFPSSYDNDTLSRLASRSNQWYSCMADHVSALQYEAENAGYNL